MRALRAMMAARALAATALLLLAGLAAATRPPSAWRKLLEEPVGGQGEEATDYIVLARDAGQLPRLQALCDGGAAPPAAPPECLLLRGLCRHVFRSTVTGVAGRFSRSQLGLLSRCLDGGVAHVERDGRVTKAEHNYGQYERWWEAQPPAATAASTSSGGGEQATAAAASDTAEPRVTAQDGGEGEAPQVQSAAETRSQLAERSVVTAWLLRQLGEQAQQGLAGGALPAITRMDAAAPTAQPFVDPKGLSDPGISVSSAQLSAGDAGAAMSLPGVKTQRVPVALWNLDSVDQRAPPLDWQYTYGSATSAGTGQGVTIYTIDSGVVPSHQEFRSLGGPGGSRASVGWDLVEDGHGTSDCDGHGTHVASTAIGRAVGVAKEATVVAVRVLDCDGSGSISDTVAAMDWVARNAVRPAVVTMSLGVASGTWSRLLEAATRSLVVDHNITVVVAAGNSAVDSCGIAPARVPEVIAVGAVNLPSKFSTTAATDRDVLYRWSNTGVCVDVFAPGVDIYGACGGAGRCKVMNNESYTWASGTSMAVPHVAGAAALFLADNPTATPAQVRHALLRAATRDRIADSALLPGTVNNNLFTSALMEPAQLAALPPPAEKTGVVTSPPVVQLSEPVAGGVAPSAQQQLLSGVDVVQVGPPAVAPAAGGGSVGRHLR